MNVVTVDKVDFYILLAISEGPLHGYGIADKILADSASSIVVAPTNLYRYLYRLEDHGLLTPLEEPVGPVSRRKRYQLTTLGRRILRSEATHWERAARQARARLA